MTLPAALLSPLASLVASPVASTLAKLALSVCLLAAGAGAGWWMRGTMDAPVIADLAAQVQLEQGRNHLLQLDQNRTRASISALQGQAQACLERESRYGRLYAKASAALDTARAGGCGNATPGNHGDHGDLLRILNEASAGRWDE